MTTAASLEDIDITSPEIYRRHGYPYDAWATLRREAPVYFYDRPGLRSFWAITKYEDVQTISHDPHTFSNKGGLVVAGDPAAPSEFPEHHLLVMDPPEHGKYRNLTNRRFTPGGLEILDDPVERLSQQIVDDVSARLVDDLTSRAQADFVTDLAAKLPLAVICQMLGVPSQDWDNIFQWTNEVIGGGDPEYQAGRSRRETVRDARNALFARFAELIVERRAAPQDDLVSVLAGSEIDGDLLPDDDILNYCFILILGGNETTRNATSGGVLALIENPQQQARLRENPDLLSGAVEEILRWTSPIIHFARTAAIDVTIRGQHIPAGDQLIMWFPSANRDEEIFDAPNDFDIARTPNDHLAFGGFGEHFCLGANLARRELIAIFRAILAGLDDLQLNRDVERLRSEFVGGIKHLPVSYRARS